MSRVDVYRDEERREWCEPPGLLAVQPGGKWRWRFVASNGRILADSGQGYSRRIDCLNGCATVLGGWVTVEGSRIWRRVADLTHDPVEQIDIHDLTREATS